MQRLASVAALVRWGNALMACAGVLLGAWWIGADITSRAVLLATAAAFALAAFANASNDYYDRDIDAVAHPDRPLPRGSLTPRFALGIAGAAAVGAVAFAAGASRGLGILTLGILAVMAEYSRWIKRLGLAGNITVAVLASLPFLYGGWAGGNARAALPLVALAIPLHLAREIAKDLDDVEGDRGVRHTLPVSLGAPVARGALLIALALFAGLLAGFAFTWPPFGLVMIPALALCGGAAARALIGQRGGPRLFKSAMLAAMAGLVLVRVAGARP